MEEVLLKFRVPNLCIQTFGYKQNPAIFLIAGAAGQGILWSDKFCQLLSNEGYFVVRFDNRDTGKSSSFDYELNPYDLKIMAEDVVSILDDLELKDAHIVGMSMGGYIAQYLHYYFPERVKSICLFMTTINSLALRGVRNICGLPGHNPLISQKIAEIYQRPRNSLEDRIKSLTEVWALFNGDKFVFPYDEMYELARCSYERATSKNAVRNHRLAVLNSEADRRKFMLDRKIPCLIIHGEADPIIRIEHAYYASENIKNSKLQIIKNMGHIFSNAFASEISEKILAHIEKNL